MKTMISLKEAEKKLIEEGIPIRYHTLYQWARKGFTVDNAIPIENFSTQVGNNWFIWNSAFDKLIKDIKSGKRIRNHKKKAEETRGRKRRETTSK